MSGWYYLLDGEGPDFKRGPIFDSELRQLVANGTINSLTKLLHDTHTRGQWVDYPRISGRLPSGSSQDQSPRRPPLPVTAEVVPDAPTSAKGLSTQTIVIVVACVVGGALLSLVLPRTPAPPTKPTEPQKEVASEKPVKKEPITIYVAVDDLICATDPGFLDSSALVAPARFMKVPKGTEVVMVDIGGMFSGNMYYGLSAGGRDRVYVYRRTFHDSFRESRKVERE